jgi:hypothetical protein
MAKNDSFRILIAYKGFERFAAIIRSQEMAGREAAQLKSAIDVKTSAQSHHFDPNPKPNNQTKEHI